MKIASATAARLLAALDLFPAFEGEIDDSRHFLWARNHLSHPHVRLHTFFGKNRKAFSEWLMPEFAELVNLAIGATRPLENTVSTCFLYCARRNRVLRAAMAKARWGTAGRVRPVPDFQPGSGCGCKLPKAETNNAK
jgi:hypothetical protein